MLKFTQARTSFSISNGVSSPTSILIIIAQKNVTGTLKKANGQPIGEAWLHLHRTDRMERMGYGVNVKNGVFSVALVDGKYMINRCGIRLYKRIFQ